MTNKKHLPVNHVNVIIRVRYSECDAQQIVFNARYAEYADLAATEYMRALIGNHNNLLENGYDTRVVNLNIDWFSPAIFDDILRLQVKCEHIGNTSFRLVTTCTKEDQNGDDVAVATIRVNYVVISTQTAEKAPIPRFLIDHLNREFSVTSNQAG